MPKFEMTLPTANDAEKTVLGAVMLENNCIMEAQQFLSADDFYLDSHRKIYRAMELLSAQNTAIDIVTMSNTLAQRRELEACGGAGYVSSLIDGVPHQPSIAAYVSIVLTKSRLRTVIKACQAAASRAMEDADAPEEIVAEIESKLSRMLHEKARVRSLPEIAIEFLNTLHEQQRRRLEGKLLGLPFGIPDLDHLTSGLRSDEYTVIAGRSGKGKSALLRQIAWLNARKGTGVCVFTPEISDVQFLGLLIPLEQDVAARCIRHADLTPVDMQRVEQGVDEIIKWKLHIDGTTSITISELVARAKMRVAQGDKLILVENLQLIAVPGENDPRKATSRVSAGLRDLRASTQVPVVALSQLRRPQGASDDQEPTMYDLKESGSIEQDAANVFLMHRPTMETTASTPTDQGDRILIPKCRFNEGNLSVPLLFNKKVVCFEQRGLARGAGQ